MAAQDFDLYTEVDGGSSLSRTDTLLTVSGMGMDENTYLYYDFGAGYFEKDIHCYFKINISSYESGASWIVAMFANDANNPVNIEGAGGDYIAIRIYESGGELFAVLRQCNSGSVTEGTAVDIDHLAGDDAYLMVTRREGRNQFSFYITPEADWHYDPGERMDDFTLVDTIDFRYFYAVSSYFDGTASTDVSFTIDDLYVGGVGDDADLSYSGTLAFTTPGSYNMSESWLVDNMRIMCKTASDRWYLLSKVSSGGTYVHYLSYSDNDGSSWTGPSIFSGPTSWYIRGMAMTPYASANYDDFISAHIYPSGTQVYFSTWEGLVSVNPDKPPSTSYEACSYSPGYCNIQQTNESFLVLPAIDGSSNRGWYWHYADADAGSWTKSSFIQEANAFGNPLDFGGIYAMANRDGSAVHVMLRSYAAINYDYVRLRRIDVENHTLSTGTYIVSSNMDESPGGMYGTIDLDGYLHLTWHDGEYPNKIQYAKVQDNGDGTYTVLHGPITVSFREDSRWRSVGIFVNALGEIFIGGRQDIDNDECFIVKSEDGGEIWGEVYRKSGTDLGWHMYCNDPNRAHTYLSEGGPPFLFMEQGDDDIYFYKDDNQGDWLNAWPDEEEGEDLDGGDWGRKVKITINGSYVEDDCAHFPVILNKDSLPDEMFDADGDYPAQEGGYDIRASLDAEGTQRLPLDIREFHIDNDPDNGYANICVGFPNGEIQEDVDVEFYIWYNNPDALPTNPNEEYGRTSVYDGDFIGVFPFHEDPDDSNFYDRTNNSGRFDHTNMDTSNRVEGQISHAVDFDGSTEYLQLASQNTYDSRWLFTDWPFTISYVGIAGNGVTTCRFTQSRDDSWSHWLGVLLHSTQIARLVVDDGTTDIYANSPDSTVDGTRYWVTGAAVDNTEFYCQLNAGSRGANSESQNFPTSDPIDNFTSINNLKRPGGNALNGGAMEELRISDVARSKGWSDTEYYNIFEPENFFTPDSPEDGGPASQILRRHMCNLMVD